MRYQTFLAWALASASLLAFASGCGQKKVAECNALITVINGGMQALEKGEKRPDDEVLGAKYYEEMAASMDKLAAATAGVAVTLPELKDLSGKYQKLVKDIAKAERDYAAAVHQRSAEKLATAEKTLDTVVKQEDPLVESLNKFCEAP